MSNKNFSKGFTPFTVAQSDEIYSIPRYQRLFEWDRPRIIQLMDDLYLAYTDHPEAPYYVGMLTSNNKNELIDGQQRFTVMMLLGLVFSEFHPEWQKFLFVGDKPRLFFKARSNDNAYISKKCQPTADGYENRFMKAGIACIREFVSSWNDEKKADFAEYVFSKMTFFISRIPQSYTPTALNKYFETMNSTGKNLENHEILKVELLKSVKRFDKVKLTQIWNAVSDMDRKLIRRRNKEERQGDLDKRFENAYKAIKNSDVDGLFNCQAINVLSKDDIQQSTGKAIGDIAASDEKPKQQRLSRYNGFHSIISFSEFLLQILWIVLAPETRMKITSKRNGGGVESFFDVNKLQDTFAKYWNEIAPGAFVLSMLRYRLLFDRYVVSISNNDASYDLEISSLETDKYGNSYSGLLMMYESMVYVNSSSKSYYLWLPSLLQYIDRTNPLPDSRNLYEYIKMEDEKRHPYKSIEDNSALSYNNVDRYWFWKLDFEIWRRRKVLFKDETVLQVADSYSFRRSRSIEHIAPQTPEQENTLVLTDEVRNSFGNLVMISSAQNSSLQNSTFEIKRAKVLSYIKKEMNGTIESLKMLMIYQYSRWNEEVIYQHLNKSISLLKDSFGTE